MAQENRSLQRRNWRIVLRDLAIFQIKLLLDGAKDVIISPLSVLAAAIDILKPTDERGRRFYAVMRAGERMDRWLNLFGATEHASERPEGLLNATVSGADSLLGKLSEYVLGRDEAVKPHAPEADAGHEEHREGENGEGHERR